MTHISKELAEWLLEIFKIALIVSIGAFLFAFFFAAGIGLASNIFTP